MKKVQVECFETTDGEVFTDEGEAKKHQEELDAYPDTWPYLITLSMKVQVVWDLEVDPNDDDFEDKVEKFVADHLDCSDGRSLRRLAHDELQYSDVVGGIDFVSVEEG